MRERRHVAIMFTDIVGYTAIMGSDEDKAFDMLKRNHKFHEHLIKQFNGTLIKEIGDGTLASFPLASDAVRCAIDIQREALRQHIPLKIGIHQGEMVFAGVDVLGDGVNIASRLQESAEAGCIIISDSVYKDIKNKTGIQTEFLEEKIFKNVDEPIKVYTISPGKEYKSERSPVKEIERSIVVLPFVNISGDPEQEYFCDGMTEEIINVLSHIEGLKVIARTSAFVFKGKQEDMREIGKKLNVETLLEGSVRKAGNQIRVTAQLIKTADGAHIWSDAYNRELKDIFAIQEEIAFAIVDNLKLKLIGKEKALISQNATEDLEAYNLFLKGIYYSQLFSPEAIKNSNRYYEKALKRDPEYADAFVGMAANYIGSSFVGNIPPHEAYKKAKDYINKSLDIDITNSLAHGCLGFIKMIYDWNFRKAVRELKLAIQLNPNSSFAHNNYSLFLTITGNHDEAILEAQRANQLDPLNMYMNLGYGDAYFYAGYFDEAIEVCRESIGINPNHAMTHHRLGHVYEAKSLINEAIIEYKKADELSNGGPYAVSSLACCYYLLGEKQKAAYHFTRLKKISVKEYVAPVWFYSYHLILGDVDQAYEWFKKAIDERDSYLIYLTICPCEGHRIPDESRFNELMKKAGLGNLKSITP